LTGYKYKLSMKEEFGRKKEEGRKNSMSIGDN
jgi:hypothetical protein